MHPVVAQGEGSRGRGFLSPALKQNSGLPTNTDTHAGGDTARQRQGGWRKAWRSDQWEGRRECGGTREGQVREGQGEENLRDRGQCRLL